MQNSSTKEKHVHCEHAIPISLVGRYIYEYLNNSSVYELGKFMYLSQVICCLTKDEEKYELKKTRSFDHPNFKKNKKLSNKLSIVSNHGTKIKIERSTPCVCSTHHLFGSESPTKARRRPFHSRIKLADCSK